MKQHRKESELMYFTVTSPPLDAMSLNLSVPETSPGTALITKQR